MFDRFTTWFVHSYERTIIVHQCILTWFKRRFLSRPGFFNFRWTHTLLFVEIIREFADQNGVILLCLPSAATTRQVIFYLQRRCPKFHLCEKRKEYRPDKSRKSNCTSSIEQSRYSRKQGKYMFNAVFNYNFKVSDVANGFLRREQCQQSYSYHTQDSNSVKIDHCKLVISTENVIEFLLISYYKTSSIIQTNI